MGTLTSILKISVAAAMLATAATATAQNTQRLAATKANDYALVYTLPQTRLAVTIEAEMKIKRPGEF